MSCRGLPWTASKSAAFPGAMTPRSLRPRASAANGRGRFEHVDRRQVNAFHSQDEITWVIGKFVEVHPGIASRDQLYPCSTRHRITAKRSARVCLNSVAQGRSGFCTNNLPRP